MSRTVLTLLVAMVMAPLALTLAQAQAQAQAQTASEKMTQTLVTETLVALAQTSAAPLANLLSSSASSLLAEPGGKLVHTSRPALDKMTTWADVPLLTDQAKVGKLDIIDHSYAVSATAQISDGDKHYVLTGAADQEGDNMRWLTVAVQTVPATGAAAGGQAGVAGAAGQAEQGNQAAGAAAGADQAVVQRISQWSNDLLQGRIQEAFGVGAEGNFSLAVVGPDYGFYVFGTPWELSNVMGQAEAAGGMSLEVPETPKVTIDGDIAVARLKWAMRIGTFQPVDADVLIELYRDKTGWTPAGVCALPPVAPTEPTAQPPQAG